MRGLGAVVKDVAEVSVAFSARDRGADDSECCVTGFADVLGSDGRPETGPPCAGLELGGGIEERIVATDAAIDAFVVQVPVFPGKRDFGIGIAGNVEDSGGELLAPFAGGLDYFRDADWLQALTRVGEKNDRDFLWRAVGSRGGF